MKSHLEALPIELIEHIVIFLPLDDIASLRLTSRAMDHKASQGSFATFFKHKDVELTTTTLQDMLRLTSHGRLGCLLEHCNITGVVRSDTTAADEGADQDLRTLLSEAFRNLKLRSSNGGLASLCLRVVASIEDADGELEEPDYFGDWKSVWSTALRTFQLTMGALQDSQLSVEDLDIFGGLKGCSLACDDFLAFAQQSILWPVFGSVKRLTMSLSVSPAAATDPESGNLRRGTDAHAQSRHSQLLLRDLLQVLHIMPQLESLNVHWYNLGEKAPFAPPFPSDPQLANSISPGSVPCLKECSLRGIHVSESDLLHFLEAIRPSAVTLTNIRLVSGTYASILRYLTDPKTPVTMHDLDDNCEQNTKLVHFEVPGNPKFKYIGGNVGPSSIVRRGSQAKEAISYRLPPGRVIGAGERNRWLKVTSEEFGPLDGHYNFVGLNRVGVLISDDDSDYD